MELVDLTPKLLRELILYDPDTGKMFWKERDVRFFGNAGSAFLWNADNAGAEIFKASDNAGYRHQGVVGVGLKGHRVAWAMIHGEWPTGEIDHINGQRRDNRILNLRDVDATLNQRNKVMLSNNTSGHVGVQKTRGGKFVVKILKTHIGTYDTFDEAVKARQDAQAVTPGFTQRHGTHGIKNYGFSHLKQAKKDKRKAKRIAKREVDNFARAA